MATRFLIKGIKSLLFTLVMAAIIFQSWPLALGFVIFSLLFVLLIKPKMRVTANDPGANEWFLYFSAFFIALAVWGLLDAFVFEALAARFHQPGGGGGQ